MTNINEKTKLFGSSFNPYNDIHKMYVDNVEVKITNNDVFYNFTTIGEHTIKCVFCKTPYVKGLFSYCKSLVRLDLSKFDASNITDMSWMFSDCENLSSLDLRNFDTSSVTNMEGMFARCSKLTSLDVSSFDTSNVTNMGIMFNYCSSLSSLDLSNFNTSNVNSINEMFSFCTKLTYIDFSNSNLKNVTNYINMFRYICEDGMINQGCYDVVTWNTIFSDSKSNFPSSWKYNEC